MTKTVTINGKPVFTRVEKPEPEKKTFSFKVIEREPKKVTIQWRVEKPEPKKVTIQFTNVSTRSLIPEDAYVPLPVIEHEPEKDKGTI